MNFKIKTFSMLLAGAGLAFTACNNDDLLNGGNMSDEYDGKYLHIRAGITLPNDGTRSQTDEDGETNSNAKEDFEYGQSFENEVRTMILVFADKDDNYIAHSVVTGIAKAPAANSPFNLIVDAEIKHADLEAAYGDTEKPGLLATDQTVHVYAICNYTARLLDLFQNGDNGSYENWLDWAGTVTEEPSLPGQTPNIYNTIWAQRSFLMTNYETNEIDFPESIDVWDEKYSDKDTPFDISDEAIKVERSAARLDFKDGSPSTSKPNTYPLYIDPNSKVDDNNPIESVGENLISIELTRMALVNMSKNFYYFRRVSDDGTNTSASMKVGGVETPRNYVVDTDYAAKQAVQGILPGTGPYTDGEAEADHFNFCLYDNNSNYAMDQWYIDDISDVLASDKLNDNWNGTAGTANTGSYKIWRYVTENTIPTIDQQKTVQSTGIVFKGRIIPGKDVNKDYISQDVIDALNPENVNENSPVLFSYERRLFKGFEGIINAAIKEGYSSPLANVVNGVLEHWQLSGTEYKYVADANQLDPEKALNVTIYANIKGGTDKNTIENTLNEENFEKYAAANDITIYRPSNDDGKGWGYYCYYFYWNRHFDNLQSGRMGIMEFATVRNNVYKLSVTSIGKIGHPRNTDDDPDPVEPEDPDEDPTNYIRVNVEVLPWVVRENSITF